jgi:hypothetical protein
MLPIDLTILDDPFKTRTSSRNGAVESKKVPRKEIGALS